MKSETKGTSYFKKFWEGVKSPLHAHNSEDWFDKYFKEILFYLDSTNGELIDVGCGSGEFLIRLSPLYSKLYGVDYSHSMLEQAQRNISLRNINNVSLYQGSITELDKFTFSGNISTILCNGVIQYLSGNEVNDFIGQCNKLLQPMGSLLIMNIPNYNLKELYNVRFYKRSEKINFIKLVKEVFKFHYTIFKEKLKNRKYKYYDGIGNWFTFNEIEMMATNNNFNVEFFYSIYPPYGYRFHAKLTKKNDR